MLNSTQVALLLHLTDKPQGVEEWDWFNAVRRTNPEVEFDVDNPNVKLAYSDVSKVLRRQVELLVADGYVISYEYNPTPQYTYVNYTKTKYKLGDSSGSVLGYACPTVLDPTPQNQGA